MSHPGRSSTVPIDVEEARDDYIDPLMLQWEKAAPYGYMEMLTTIYAIDQNLGQSIHDAYRKAISAAIDGADNLDELIAELKSMDRKPTSGNSRRVACLFVRFIYLALVPQHTNCQMTMSL